MAPRRPRHRASDHCGNRMACATSGTTADMTHGSTAEKGFIPVTGTTHDIGRKIANELASCDVKLIASLPDNWLMDVINTVKRDDRFVHIPVNREESAVGLCSGAYMGTMRSATLMGASGFMTVSYAITKINYTYEISLFVM